MDDDEIRRLEAYPYDERAVEEEKNSEVAATEKSGNDAETETVIYVGPNIFTFALQRFQVFRGGLPPYVKRAIEKIPEIRSLIVPVSELEKARAKIDKPGTSEARFFVAVQKAAEKLNRERTAKK